MEDAQPTASEIVHLMAALWKSRFILLAGLVLGVLSGVLAAWIIDPVYRVRVVMMPNQDADLRGSLGSVLDQAGGLAALVGLGRGGGERLDESIAVLTSRQFAESFIVDNELLPSLFPEEWDSKTGAWKSGGSVPPTLNDAVNRFDKEVRKVRQDARTGLVTLEFTWPERVEAATLANSMIRRLNDSIRDQDVVEATRNIKQLQAELARTSEIAVQVAIQRLIETNVKRRSLANTRSDYVFRVIDPAMPPDSGDYFRPQRGLYAAAGGLCGLFLGIFFSALRRFVEILRPLPPAGVA